MKLRKISLKWKLFLYIFLFAVAIVAIFCFFQIGLLEKFYRTTKIKNMNQLMDEVSSTVESNTMSDLVTPGQIQLGLTQKFDNSEASFFLYKRETTTTDKTEVSFISIVATYGTTSCKLLSNPISMMEVWDKAAKYQSSKEKFYIFESNNIDSRFNLMITDSGKKSSDTSITCCQFVKIEGTLYLLILDGRLTPV